MYMHRLNVLYEWLTYIELLLAPVQTVGAETSPFSPSSAPGGPPAGSHRPAALVESAKVSRDECVCVGYLSCCTIAHFSRPARVNAFVAERVHQT